MLEKNSDSKNNHKEGFSTLCVHGIHHENPYNSLEFPVFMTSTYRMKSVKHVQDAFAGLSDDFAYSRFGNPTVRELEIRVAKMHEAEDGLAFSSGLSAIISTLMTFLSSGDHIIVDTVIYGPVSNALKLLQKKYNVNVEAIDMTDLNLVEKTLTANTKILYIETPANPNLKITDIQALAILAKKKNPNIQVLCDNTFASPYLQKPLLLGVDIVMESATKYLNGHGDVIAGIAVGSTESMKLIKAHSIKTLTGACLSPLQAFLIMRGIKTLKLRMEKHCHNAEVLARFLVEHPLVDKVMYPGLESHPNHEVAKKQMKLFGGILSFDLKGDEAKTRAIKFFEKVKVASTAVSLGDTETLILPAGLTTHANLSQEEKQLAGITDSFIRVSVGLESSADIVDDFEQALRG